MKGVMSLIGTKLPKLVGQSMSALPGNSDINLFCYGQGVIDLDAEVSDGLVWPSRSCTARRLPVRR